MFDEAAFEQMVCDTLSHNGWKYISADDLPRHHSDVLVEPMVKDALIRLNPCIAEDPSRADEVIYKLRTLILSVQPHNLVAQNEEFKKLVFENNSFPFGENGRMIPVTFFGSLNPEEVAKKRVCCHKSVGVSQNRWWKAPGYCVADQRLSQCHRRAENTICKCLCFYDLNIFFLCFRCKFFINS